MKLKNVRINNLLKVGNNVIFANDLLLEKLKENNYEYGLIEGQPIDSFMKKRILADNPGIDEEYLLKFTYVHDLQNDYYDNHSEDIIFEISE